MSAAPDDQAGRNPQAHHVINIPMPARAIARGDGFSYARAEQHLTIIAGGHTPDRMTISRPRAMKFAAIPEFHNYTAQTDPLFRQPG